MTAQDKISCIKKDMDWVLAQKKRCMGIDYGTKNTGIAVTDAAINIVVPVGIIRTTKMAILLKNIDSLITKYEVGLLVVGTPDSQIYNADRQLNFVSALQSLVKIPIYLQDEYFTSINASHILTDAGFKKGRAANLDDKIAAKIILEDFLDKWRSTDPDIESEVSPSF